MYGSSGMGYGGMSGGYGGGMSSMGGYGGGYGGYGQQQMGQNGMNQGQQLNANGEPMTQEEMQAAQEEQQKSMQRQQEIRQNIQGFTSGLSSSVGLAYGMTQVGYLGSQGIKFLYTSLKYTLKMVFNSRNITGPIKFLCKLLLGIDFDKQKPNTNSPQFLNQKLFDDCWKETQKQINPQQQSGLITKAFKTFKKLIYLAVGLAMALVAGFFLNVKRNQLRDKEKREKQEKLEKFNQMEEEWKQLISQNKKVNIFMTDNVIQELPQRCQKLPGHDSMHFEEDIEDELFELQDNNTQNSAVDIEEIDEMDEETKALEKEITAMQNSSTTQASSLIDQDQDLNINNFNLMKNSKAFTSQKSKRNRLDLNKSEDIDYVLKKSFQAQETLGNPMQKISEEDSQWFQKNNTFLQ